MSAFLVCLTISFLPESGICQTPTDSIPATEKVDLTPRRMMIRSAIIPGWGQLGNQQAWKIPIVYAGLAGLIWYNREQDRLYREFRAAYYNESNPETPGQFGPTPGWLAGSDTGWLKRNRDFFRNRRDISFVYIGLMYGFNALDAYIWAHLRMFDVSDDLSVAPSLAPGPNGLYPVISTRIRF